MLTDMSSSTALTDLAVELYHRGRHEDAARYARKALENKGSLGVKEIIQWSLLLAMCERAAGRDEAALKTHLEVSPLVELLNENARDEVFLRGKYHNGLAITYKKLGHADKAFQEYAAASVYYEKAGEWRHRADVENNIANLLIQLGHFD